MLHPRQEWHDNVLTSGFFYGPLTQATGICALILGYFTDHPLWLLLSALVLVLAGFGVELVSIYQYGRIPEEEK